MTAGAEEPTTAIVNTRVGGRPATVLWRAGEVIDVVADGRLRRGRGIAHVIDAGGGATIPGLHDHHAHPVALAATRQSVRVGPPDVFDVDGLAAALTSAPPTTGGWIRAIGYHESVAGELDAATLDRLVPLGRPARVQHRTGQMWAFNSAALEQARIAELEHPGVERDSHGRPTGRLFGLDDELRVRLPSDPLDVLPVLHSLAAVGVTGVTDMTPWREPSDLDTHTAAMRGGSPVDVWITGAPELPSEAAPDLPRGPVKLLPADHADPDLAALRAGIAAAHRAGRPAAVHCVTRVGLVVALAAWAEVGHVPGDRLEHGAVIPPELIDDLRRAGLIVVTQPNLVTERGDAYLADVDPRDQPDLWRCASLFAADVAVAGGTDHPFGHHDPWRAIAAATQRTTASGQPLGPDERIDAATALDLFLGAPLTPHLPRRVAPGVRTALCVLDRPLADALAAPDARYVQTTVTATTRPAGAS